MIRPSRVLAIARRDLALELKGRQGLVLPAVMAGLLVPAATLPSPRDRLVAAEQTRWVVTGDVPPEVLALEGTVVRTPAAVWFDRQDDGTLLVHGHVPKAVREALDGPDPEVVLVSNPRGYVLPGRTMLLSLITSSTLTGAVAAAIGGERSRKTLVVLLAAAVTRWELVLGKFLAWSGVGAGTSLLAAAVALALGKITAGWWLLPMVLVPAVTVALGLWLGRRATDVVAGTATSLRVLPAALSLLAIGAWMLGELHPLLGAAVPIGGALIAAGDTWTGPIPPLVASASTLAITAFFLAGTVRDLEEVPSREPPEGRTALALLAGALAAAVWWLPIGAPLLWELAGNARLTEELSRQTGVFAGVLALGTFTAVRAARIQAPARAIGLVAPTPAGWAAAALAAAGLIGAAALAAWGPDPGDGWQALRGRMSAAVQPDVAGPVMVIGAILADELFFRGWLARSAGPVRAGLVWVCVKRPLDPLTGVVEAALLGALAHRSGSVWTAVSARLGCAALSLALPALSPTVGLGLVALAGIGVALATRGRAA